MDILFTFYFENENASLTWDFFWKEQKNATFFIGHLDSTNNKILHYKQHCFTSRLLYILLYSCHIYIYCYWFIFDAAHIVLSTVVCACTFWHEWNNIQNINVWQRSQNSVKKMGSSNQIQKSILPEKFNQRTSKNNKRAKNHFLFV